MYCCSCRQLIQGPRGLLPAGQTVTTHCPSGESGSCERLLFFASPGFSSPAYSCGTGKELSFSRQTFKLRQNYSKLHHILP